MKPRALIVEDDSNVMPPVEDVLFSMGHSHAWVTNQQDAQQMLASQKFHYVLLDLAIPARSGGQADKQFGINLLEYIHYGCELPVLIMTAYLADCVDLGNQLRELGANDCVAKPFQNRGRDLAKKIRKILSKPGNGARQERREKFATPRAFAGGQLVFFKDRVELANVKIITDRGSGTSLLVLRELGRQDAYGRFVRLSADDLAQRTGAVAGETVIACIQTLRRNMVNRCRKVGIEVQASDVIDRDEQGYFLRDWIAVTTVGDGSPAGDPPERGSPPPAAIKTVSGHEEAGVNERQAWALAHLRRGRPLRREQLELRFEVGMSTAKRDLVDLTRRGLVRFIRQGRSGFYELAEAPAMAAAESP